MTNKLVTDDKLHRLKVPAPKTPVAARAPEEARSPNRSGAWIMALCLLMVGAALFALLGHPPAHWTGLWPVLLVLLCPLLHFLMHRGHGTH